MSHHFSQQPAMLHLLCGKIASGKSTLARKLANAPLTVLLSEDRWLAALYADRMTSVADYVDCSARLWEAIKPHLTDLLNAGVSVVLDFPANTLAHREAIKDIIITSNCHHRLHFLNVPDATCKARLLARNQNGEHDFEATEAQYDLISRYFVTPQPDEGFSIIYYDASGEKR
ncbi:ATP-binding protein [Pantoea sp. MBD-2R]|uniref:AAA family ATPase n=1 Tax=unclassified Pantoea TaxID=2630326 RepID=UPI0011BDEBBA|nr:ATP-binding protein [Pantoea sp. CCBC3-3-1]